MITNPNFVQALSIKHDDVVTETKEQQQAIAKEWFDKYGSTSPLPPAYKICLHACNLTQ